MTTSHATHPAGAQALMRGLAAMDAVAAGATTLAAIGERIQCTRSTTHRLVAALVHAGYLRHDVQGYRLGLRLVSLGSQARQQLPLATLARPIIEALAEASGDSVHLGIREQDDVVYLDKVAGSRGLEMRSRPGLRMPLALTGIGRALMLDLDEDEWQRLYTAAIGRRTEQQAPVVAGLPPLSMPQWSDYLARLARYREAGVVFDLEDNERGIRCVAAPVRDAQGAIVAALSIASATPWMLDARMAALAPQVRQAAVQLSHQLAMSSAGPLSPSLSGAHHE